VHFARIKQIMSDSDKEHQLQNIQHLEPVVQSHVPLKPAPDPKALRVESVGKLLDQAYQRASTLKLTDKEARELRAPFPDDAVEIRPHDGALYISHMALRERLWEVFGPGEVAEICRDKFIRADTHEVAVDLVLIVRGCFVAEAIGTAQYFASNRNQSYGDVVESAWSDALRRCCKKFGIGTQVWRPSFIREFLRKHPRQRKAYELRSETEGEQRDAETASEKTDSQADWRSVTVHFGKNRGVRLGDLAESSVQWYARDWLQSKIKSGDVTPQDRILIDALMARERESRNASQSEEVKQ